MAFFLGQQNKSDSSKPEGFLKPADLWTQSLGAKSESSDEGSGAWRADLPRAVGPSLLHIDSNCADEGNLDGCFYAMLEKP